MGKNRKTFIKMRVGPIQKISFIYEKFSRKLRVEVRGYGNSEIAYYLTAMAEAQKRAFKI